VVSSGGGVLPSRRPSSRAGLGRLAHQGGGTAAAGPGRGHRLFVCKNTPTARRRGGSRALCRR
jgi:hypothetical protein